MAQNIATRWQNDGYVFPLDILSASEARDLRDELESAEAELDGNDEQYKLLHAYPDRLLPAFDQLTRHPLLTSAVSEILGPDLMVWSAALFIKEARSDKIVSWHQDLTYWDLDDVEEVTAWVALSPVTTASGCMRFVPGSHKFDAVEHVDTFASNNLLSRGQEIAVEVDESDSVSVELQPGQASLHHGHLFHASGPNTTSDRRIASAIRYIKPSMSQKTDLQTLVSLVSGEDRHGNFKIAGIPADRLLEEDFELCRQDAAVRRKLLYKGVDASSGKRY